MAEATKYSPCQCGCGKQVAQTAGRGQPKKWATRACRKRARYRRDEERRRALRQERGTAMKDGPRGGTKHPIEAQVNTTLGNYCPECHYLEKDHVDGQCPYRPNTTGGQIDSMALNPEHASGRKHMLGHGGRRSTHVEPASTPLGEDDVYLELLGANRIRITKDLRYELAKGWSVAAAIDAVAFVHGISREAIAAIGREADLDEIAKVDA